jgi:acid phosphatase type 7
MLRRCAPVAVLALCALTSMASPAAGAPRLSASRDVALPGQVIRLAGHGFPARARVRVTLAGRRLRRVVSGPRGGFRLRLRVPPRLTAGRYRLVARSRRAVARLRVRVRARARPRQPRPGPAPAPSTAPPAPPPLPDPVTLVAVGDIACRPGLPETATACRHARTAELAASLAPDAVTVLGDNQYEHGELANFQAVYEPTWGRFKAITRPVAGNHEYEGDPERDEAPGYYTYFGAAAGDPGSGYYRWELGGWTVLTLNSGAINWTREGNPGLPDDCWPVSCAAGSGQEQWLRAQLATLPDEACVIATWHHPRFSSGFGGTAQPHPEVAPLFQALYEHGAELLLSGHSHNYERFVPVAPEGGADLAGVAQFVVGTGGRSLHTSTGPQPPTSQVLRTDAFGVLELTLEPGRYAFRFVAEGGQVLDAGAGSCHA